MLEVCVCARMMCMLEHAIEAVLHQMAVREKNMEIGLSNS